MQQEHNNRQIAAEQLHDIQPYHYTSVIQMCQVGQGPCRLYLPGCNDMLHKPCAHSNKHNSLQRLQLSKSRLQAYAAGRLCA
jgi:hypothetical protein